MVGVVILSHGDMAAGMLGAAEMIMGSQEGIKALGLQPNEGPEQLREELFAAVSEVASGDGVLVLADLYGGSPANTAAYLLQEDVEVDVVTGVNLPMLVEVLTLRQNMSLGELAGACKPAGTEGIKRFSEEFKGKL